MGLQIGTPIGGSISPASDADRDSWTRLFHEQSTSPISHNFEASNNGILLMGFGLKDDDRVCVEMVVGCKDGSYFEPIRIARDSACGCDGYCLHECNNILFVPYPIRMRLRYTGDRIGLFQVFASEVPAFWLPVLAGQRAAPEQPPLVGRVQC
ncbi:MAG: hypothetical protein WAS51_14410 [Ilumatobacteraceae bacterium]